MGAKPQPQAPPPPPPTPNIGSPETYNEPFPLFAKIARWLKRT